MSTTPFELERALVELARDHAGWHTCGQLVRRGGTCDRCGPVPSGDVLALGDPRVSQIQRNLVSANVRAVARDRARAALGASFAHGGAKLVGGDR